MYRKVINTIKSNTLKKQNNIFFILSIFFTSILLHQSNVVFGVNISFADLFCLFILLFLMLNKQLLMPIGPLLFFLIISVLVLATAYFYIPIKYDIAPNSIRIISDYTKLLATFSYFIIGYNLATINLLKPAVRWYSYFGLFIGMAGIVITILNIRVFSEILFFGETRFKGLMIDPNYFSVLQITALVYLTRSEKIKARYKILAVFIMILSVLISGSKTGIITLFSYFILRTVEYFFLTRKKLSTLIFQLFFTISLVVTILVFFDSFQIIFSYLSSAIPSFSRIHLLFSDFISAISEGGSGREDTWRAALQVIQLSPVIGIGIGTYTTIAWEMFHYNNVAHNTFLQISAEWGIPFAVIFFSFVFFLLGKATRYRNQASDLNIILRDMIFILLIGSLAISLNNARVLWLFLGALVFSLNGNKRMNSGIQI
ncbi:O-antigen ligase domain-containing protein [Neobacillus mesonae]|uniref:O-antigen ligase domain-containing protein n=2 Tax=Neobacillus mesonae TaxID=1193713 RepID=A0A3T0I370_9BACI|nr:O-antigen ligase domain-containing protein [Neobacillus mesonae]